MIDKILESYEKELLLEFEYGVQSPMTVRERKLYRAYKELRKALESIASIKYDNLGYSPEDAQCMNEIARQALQSMKGGETE